MGLCMLWRNGIHGKRRHTVGSTCWTCRASSYVLILSGQFFLTHLDRQLCVHSMNPDKNGQPGVFQNILHPEKKWVLLFLHIKILKKYISFRLFREELHQYFAVSRKSSSQSRTTATTSEMPSGDTASFHSAMSRTVPVRNKISLYRLPTWSRNHYIRFCPSLILHCFFGCGLEGGTSGGEIFIVGTPPHRCLQWVSGSLRSGENK